MKDENIPIGNISVNEIEKKHNYCNVVYVILYNYWGNGVLIGVTIKDEALRFITLKESHN